MRQAITWVLGVSLWLVAAPAPAQFKPATTQAAGTQIGGKTLKQWVGELKDRDPSSRQNALRSIAYFGKEGREAMSAVIATMRDRDASCRVNAIQTLTTMLEALSPPDIVRAVDTLADRLNNDTQAIVRFQAAMALSMFGSYARPAIPNLVKQIRDQGSWEIRRAVVSALVAAGADSRLGPEPQALRALTGMFLTPTSYEESAQVRLEAVMGLGSMGKSPNPAELALEVQAIQRALKDNDKTVAVWAQAALMALDRVSDEGLNVIARQLKNKDSQVKMHAARALAAMGREAKDKVSDVVALLEDPDPMVVAGAVGALAEFGPNARSALPALNALAQGKQNDYLREAAREAIKKIGTDPGK